ncbi:cory-CC-star protein [Microbacterium sp. AR7-10]|uniref:cory-CC-star protein n=1 Tax=Microbacterium sp. AR7-10 TaxID=1891970 RepID=UPI0008FC1F06|nr:cory-CC-star protein [Microbacterium sp. AR7-10]OIU87586.1 DNA helicase [Microbacterium sp. AR7-10]
MVRTEAARRLRGRWAALRRGMAEYYAGPYRQMLAREQRDEDDLFALVVLGEALGVPDPAAYYSAELMPLVADDFHRWHRRMGMPRSPLDSMTCC